MRMNTTQIQQTLTQFPAEAIPADHPAVAKLESIFGDHTFFLDGNGLNIVEPLEKDEASGPFLRRPERRELGRRLRAEPAAA